MQTKQEQPSPVARHVREAREAKHWSQWDLAQRSGVTVTTISRTECSRTTPKLPTLEALATGLGVSLAQLVNGAG